MIVCWHLVVETEDVVVDPHRVELQESLKLLEETEHDGGLLVEIPCCRQTQSIPSSRDNLATFQSLFTTLAHDPVEEAVPELTGDGRC